MNAGITEFGETQYIHLGITAFVPRLFFKEKGVKYERTKILPNDNQYYEQHITYG